MKKILTHIGFLILGIIMLSSCTQDIDFALNESEEEILVVEGYFSNEVMEHTVNLSLSGKFYGSEALPKAEGAVVTIAGGSSTFNLSETEPGVYKTDATAFGTFGTEYTLTIVYNGETYSSTSTLDSVPPIDDIFVLPSEFAFGPGNGEDDKYSIFINTKEISGRGNYYMWKTIVNGNSISDTLGTFQFNNDELFDGTQYDTVLIEPFVDATVGDTIGMEQRSISKEAYDIYLASNLETVWRGGIFDSPPSNVPSNISNGAIGLFDAQGVAKIETVILF